MPAEFAPPIQVVVVNRFAPVPAIHDMVNRPGILNPQFAAHAGRFAFASTAVKCYKLGTDTFSNLRENCS
jgi:hypothetical protein